MRFFRLGVVTPLLALLAIAGTASRADAGAVLDKIMMAKTISLGVRTDAPPFAVKEGSTLKGFSVDLCGLIANVVVDALGVAELKGRVVQVDASNRFEKLASGDIDVLCGATTITLARREKVAFSIPTFITGVGVAVRKDAPDLLKEVLLTNSPANASRTVVASALQGRTFAVREGTTSEAWLSRSPIAGIEGVKIETVASHDEGMGRLSAGTVDAYFADRAILAGLIRKRELGQFEFSQKSYTLEPYALAIRRGDEDFRLLIDRALSKLYRSGQIFDVFEAHFGKPSQEVRFFYGAVSQPD
ncbi:amino acid ABC transporter substrate-binding protein [Nisaea acidiphila]|uniref:Amino acid ABC transporter substrate-binding protein n=1 Tax=Nisaea acidiphila TaxID=1862145 RepID=A0A9J7AVS2_9PROT|nr:amino acid ABC transporter substrate-binding protein [Nisaea acidiphila]UUX51875.1 amino acid ABC transporter substrate-binding protein [Nisaea acidiphila]